MKMIPKRPLLLLIIISVSIAGYCQTSKNENTHEKLSFYPLASVKLEGYLGNRVDQCIARRIKELDFDQFVEPFRHRNETRLWQGEFFGKLMLAAIASYEYNRDPEMLIKINEAFKGLIATQSPDGYIGNYADSSRLMQWDVWCRKYTLLSLLSYNELTGDRAALKAAVRLADYTLSQFGAGKANIAKTGNYHGMPSSSILEPMVYMFKKTGDKKYLDFAMYIVKQWETPEGPNLISKALENVPVSERFPFPKSWWSYDNGQKAYEMMSCYDGLLELYKITGRDDYLKAVEASVKNIIESEINIAGSGSAFECWYHGSQRQTEPTYHMMETCVTFTWMKLCNNLLRVTGNPLYADQIEKTAYNALPASMKYDGAQIVKYSPLEGTRSEGEKQCGMNINCCNANGPRGFMLLPQFTVMKSTRGFSVNLYCKSTATIALNQKNNVSIEQVTDYPADESISISIDPDRQEQFTVSLRIPEWSKRNEILVNGTPAGEIVPGTYKEITREWKKGDKISLKFDLTAHLITMNGYQAIVRGPVVMARDARFADRDVDEAAVVASKAGVVELKPVQNKPGSIWMAFTAPVVLGTNLEGEFRVPRQVHFCDFASAGNTWEDDSRYRVWIKQTLNVMNTKYSGY
jgi:DUF1680 family protein